MTSQIIPQPREFWMPDKSAKSCFKCEKGFKAFRRRHHCRYCGLIFCSKCTQKNRKLYDGTCISRSCDHCFTLMNNSIEQLPSSQTLPEEPRNHSASGVEDFSEFDAIDNLETLDDLAPPENSQQEVRVNELRTEMQSYRSDPLEEQANKFLEVRINDLVQQYGVSGHWLKKIEYFVKTAVSNVCPSTHYRHDYMDANKYIRIVKANWEDHSLCNYVNGIVFSKNTAHRKMPTQFRAPKILFLLGRAEFVNKDDYMPMDKLINQEDSYTKILIRKIQSFSTSVVVIEKGTSQEILSILTKLKITAIINVKKKLMEQIARVTQGQVLSSIDQISHIRDYLGTCDEFCIKRIGKNNYAFFENSDDCSLGGTIVISGPDQSELKAVSKVIRQLIREYRNVRLERSFFMQCGIEIQPRIFLDFHSSYLKTKHLVVCANRMCMKPQTHNISYYSEDDKSLGEFIQAVSKKVDDKCESGCSQIWNFHRFYFLGNGGAVKVTLLKTTNHQESSEIVMNKECKICKVRREDISVILNKASWEYSFHKFLDNFFHNSTNLHLSKKCRHQFYEGARFCFMVNSVRVIIEKETFNTYEFHKTKATTNKYYEDLLKQKFEELVGYGKELLNSLLKRSKEILVSIGNETTEFKAKQSDWEIIRNEVMEASDEIALCIGKLYELDFSTYKTTLQIETSRRALFLECCKIKVSLENSVANTKRLKHGEPIKFPQKQSISEKLRISTTPRHSMSAQEEEVLAVSSFVDSIDIQVIPAVDPFKKYDDILNESAFKYLQKGNLTLPLTRDKSCVPVYDEDLLSFIAYTLKSNAYCEQVLDSLECDGEINEFIETELLSESEKHFSMEVATEFQEISGKSETRNLYGPTMSFGITVFYPRQFHAIRLHLCGTVEKFIESIAMSQSQITELGKSGATFMLSHDNKYILKVVEEKEFRMFLDLAPNYFRHICKNFFHLMPSRLVKTLGAFRIHQKNLKTGKNKTDWMLLFENLGYQMPKKNLVYDLKGTCNQSRRVKDGKKQTKMDLNFLDDLSGMPIFLSPETKRIFDAGIWNDTLFLAKQNVVDYSLLLMICPETGKIEAGIIDYLQQYNFEKAVESKYKKVVRTELPTITHPVTYKERFRSQLINGFFLSLEY